MRVKLSRYDSLITRPVVWRGFATELERDFTRYSARSYSQVLGLPHEQEKASGWIMQDPCSKRGIPDRRLKLNIVQYEKTVS